MSLRRLNLLGLATAIGLVAIWQALVASGLVTVAYLPTPLGIARALGSLIAGGELAKYGGHTLWVTLLAWAIASVIGLIFGLLLGCFSTVWRYSMATVELLRSMPSVAFVPVSLLIFGFTAKMEIALAIYIAQWLVLVNTIDGIRSVSPQLLEVAKMLRMPWLERTRKIILPAAMPVTLVGLRLGLSVSLILAVVSEMIGNPAGLGYQLVYEQGALQTNRMFAYLVIIGAIGVVLNAALVQLTRAIPGTERRVGGAKQ